MSAQKKRSHRIGEADEPILRAVGRFGYLTAAQVSQLLYPHHLNTRYSQRRLRLLTETGFLMRLRELPTPRFGSAPLVFTLARKGRQFLADRGVALPDYFRPSEEQEKARNNPFLEHTLAATDVLIAARRLGVDTPGIRLTRIRTERDLKVMAVPISVPPPPGAPGAPRTTRVIPDGWFELAVEGEPAPFAIALEIDRGTHQQRRWREKVAALVLWAQGPYKEAFQARNLTIAVATISPARRETLRAWTRQELKERELEQYGDFFLFTDRECLVGAYEWFFGDVWYDPASPEPVGLITPPQTRPIGEEGYRAS